jgi:hypothetical protein
MELSSKGSPINFVIANLKAWCMEMDKATFPNVHFATDAYKTTNWAVFEKGYKR